MEAGLAVGSRAQALTVASFLSPERLGYPPGKAQRDRLLARVDALVATSEETAEAAEAELVERRRQLASGVGLTVDSADLYEAPVVELEKARV